MALITPDDVIPMLEIVPGVSVPAAGRVFLTKFIPRVCSLIKKFLRFDPEQPSSPWVEFYPSETNNSWFEADELVSGYDLIGGIATPRLRGDRARAAIVMRNVPVRRIVEVRENAGAWNTVGGDFGDAFIVPPQNYYPDWQRQDPLDPSNNISYTGILWRNSGVWSVHPKTIRVTYTSGFTAAELDGEYADIKLAAITAAVEWYMMAVYRSHSVRAGGPVQAVSIKDFSVTYALQQIMAFQLPDAAKEMLKDRIHVGNIL